MRTRLALDTNILLYALNADAPEYGPARAFLDEHADDSDLVISELVLVELYCLLRNPRVVPRPLEAAAAAALVGAFREHPRWMLVDHRPEVMDEVWKRASVRAFARTRIFDLRLGLGLLRHGVREIATRNVRDFEGLGFDRVWDPIATA